MILFNFYFSILFSDINIAMAVAIDGGLITPTIIKAQDLDLFSISRNWKELVEKAKNKKLTPAEYNSGDFFFIFFYSSYFDYLSFLLSYSVILKSFCQIIVSLRLYFMQSLLRLFLTIILF